MRLAHHGDSIDAERTRHSGKVEKPLFMLGLLHAWFPASQPALWFAGTHILNIRTPTPTLYGHHIVKLTSRQTLAPRGELSSQS